MWSDSRFMKNSMGLVLIGLVLLTACSGLTTSDKPASRTWLLIPLEQSVNTRSFEAVTTVDVSVVAVPGLDTDKILTLSGDAELNEFAGARWVDHTPELLESLIGRSMQGSGAYNMLSSQADCDLDLEVQEFFAYTASSGSVSEVRMVLDGLYSCRPDEAKAIHLDAVIPIYEEKMSSIVAAFQAGVDELMNDLLAGL